MPKYSKAWGEFDDDIIEYADPYPAIRKVLSADYADAAPETIERIVESVYPNMSAEDLEGFFSTLSRAGHSIGRIAQRALPGMAQGAATGTAIGGPYGGLAGLVIGGATSALSSGRSRTNGSRTQQQGPVQATGSPSAVQLLRTLARPEVGQALRSLAMGSAGQRNIKVGEQNIPIGAITNLLGQLLGRAETELHASTVGETTGTPAYLLDEAGEYIIDPSDADQRADLVLELFAQVDALEELEQNVEVIYVEADSAWDEQDEDEGICLYEGLDYDDLHTEYRQ